MENNIIKEFIIENITFWLLFSEEISEAELAKMYGLCSGERKEKTDRIKPPMKKRESIGAGYLLSVLKKRFSIEEDPVILNGGKPVFAENSSLQFSISHCRGAVLLAFGQRPLGADIEYVKKANIKVAERFFTREEYDRIAEGEGEEQNDVFCRIWTGKEAVVKAAGGGLSLPLDRFSVLEKNVDLLGKRYELHQRRLEAKGQSLWVSAAQLITDEQERGRYHPGQPESSLEESGQNR